MALWRLIVTLLALCLLSIYLIVSFLTRQPTEYQTLVDAVKQSDQKPYFIYDFMPNNSKEYTQLHWQKDILERPIELINLTSPAIPKTATLIILVPVLSSEREKRDAVRTLWGSKEYPHSQSIREGKIAVIFFCTELALSNKLRHEAETYQDILVVYGFEEYRRLVFKFYFGYKWVSHYYPQMDVAKVDTDILFIPDNLYKAVLAETRPMTATGRHVSRLVIVRDITSKWYISPAAHENPLYPPYLLGFTYFIKAPALAKIVAAASGTTVFENEDAFFTGKLRMKANVELVNTTDIFYLYSMPTSMRCDEDGKPIFISYARMNLEDLTAEYRHFKDLPCAKNHSQATI